MNIIPIVIEDCETGIFKLICERHVGEVDCTGEDIEM